MQGKVESLFSYPVKGLTGQPLERVDLEAGQGVPGDRLFGFAKASSGFDPRNPKPLPKTHFLVLAEHAKLAGLATTFDAATGVLTMRTDGGETLQFAMNDDAGKEQAASFLNRLLHLSPSERPSFAGAAPHRFTDVSVVSETMMNAVSLINLDSVADLETRIGQTVDPMRFRANLYFRGWPAMSELELENREIRVGPVVMKVLLRTQRCAATEVNPHTAQRDIRVPYLLRKTYGHLDMGIYAQVLQGGVVRPGDLVSV